MNDEIKKILEELEDNIPIEYIRSCDSPDGLGHYEQDIESWQYLLLDYITTLQQKYDEANNAINWWSNKAKELQQENETRQQDINNLTYQLAKMKEENESNINRIHELEQEIDSEYIQKEYYKSRCEKASEYLKECYSQPENIENFMTESEMNYLLNILQNGSDSQ